MLDSALAELYGVETGRLVRAMKRNEDRFPKDFSFQLTNNEFEDLKCQTGISSWGGRRYAPWAFARHGVAMLSAVLRSHQATQVGLAIVRSFVGILFDRVQALLEPPLPVKKKRVEFIPPQD